ncbi:site-specific integrase [Methylorubrum extorquens]|uniref:site-specific integrase n=1 Tax=Methylorubrum extorquens TaxID=408 RepID=UPI001EE557B1|nr:site-specific integrase [Methylorubrum extorquens]MCG5249083.1 site-specific integrase [Methylorubrum extorquens]
MNQLTVLNNLTSPALVAAAGDRAAYRFLEFFTAQLRNSNTRRAYAKAVCDFCAWLERHSLPSITAVSSIHIAAYVEELGRSHSAPTVKQRLAAIQYNHLHDGERREEGRRC